MASLPKNGNLETLIDRLVVGAKTSMVAPQPECKECEENAAAISICLDCTKYLCHTCDEYHRKARKKHNIQLLKDTEKLELKTLRCPEHKKKASLYCWSCDCLICQSCAADSRQKHGDHRREEMSAVISRCKELIRLATEGVQQVAKELRDAISEIRKVQDALEGNSKTARQQVEDGFQEALRKLYEEKKRQLENLENIHDAKRKGIASQLEQCEHMEKIVASHLECSRDVCQISEAGFLSIWSKFRDVLVSLKGAYQYNVPSRCCEVETIEVRTAQILDFTDKIGKVFVAPKDKAFTLPANIDKAVIVAGREFVFTITCTDVHATCLHYDGKLPELDVRITPLSAHRGYQAFHQDFQQGQAADLSCIIDGQGDVAADLSGNTDDQVDVAVDLSGDINDQGTVDDDQVDPAANQGGQDDDQGAAHLGGQVTPSVNQHGNHANPSQANQSGSANQSTVNMTCTTTLGPNGSYTVKLLTHHLGWHRLTFKVAGRDDDAMDPLDILVMPDVGATANFSFALWRTPVVKAKRVAIRGNLCVYTDSAGNLIHNLAVGDHCFKRLPLSNSDAYPCIGVDNVPMSPEGIAIDTDNSVIVADKTNRSAQVMKMNQNEPETLNLKLNGGEQFEGPTSIAVNRKGRIFVGDSTSIQYFNPDYTHEGQIRDWDDSMKGMVDTLFIAVDAHENLLVVSQKLGKVYVLKEDLNNYFVVYTFGDSIIGPNHNLRNPVGVAADCRYGYIYVIERERLCVFSIEGECLACFDEAHASYDNDEEIIPFIDLSGISVAKDGSVIVAHGGTLMEIFTLSGRDYE